MLQYFGNGRHNLAALVAFIKILDITKKHWTMRYQVHLILSKCYSLDLPLWLGAQPQVFATQAKFLLPSDYCTAINCTFCITNASVMYYMLCKLAITKILQKHLTHSCIYIYIYICMCVSVCVSVCVCSKQLQLKRYQVVNTRLTSSFCKGA